MATYARELFERGRERTVTVDFKGRKLFKMSLGDSRQIEEAWIYDACLEHGYRGAGGQRRGSGVRA